MQKNQLTSPLLSMAATIIMCAILSACQSTNASTKLITEIDSDDHYIFDHRISDHSQIRIHEHNGQRHYRVDGKEFTFEQLNDEQKEKINQLEKKLNQLEVAVEFDGERMEQWGNKMEVIAKKMQVEAGKFEDVMDNLEFEGHSHNIKEFSAKMEKMNRKLEEKMYELEKQMRAMEIQMPTIDQQKISEIEVQAEKLEELLIEISRNL